MQGLLDLLQPAHILQTRDIDLLVGDHLQGDDVLVRVGLDRAGCQTELASDLFFLVLSGLLGVRVRVHLVEGQLEEEPGAPEGGGEDDKLWWRGD